MRKLSISVIFLALSVLGTLAQPFLQRYENMYVLLHSGMPATLLGAALLEGIDSRFDGKGGIYLWSANSRDATNSLRNVVQIPGVDPGRWYRVSLNESGGTGTNLLNGTLNRLMMFTPNGSNAGDSIVAQPDTNTIVVTGATEGGIALGGASSVPGLYSSTNNNNGALNVLSFGAIGDGTSDDTAAIQSAYNAIKGSGGTLLFPPTSGYYRFNLVVNDDNINLAGLRHNTSTEAEPLCRPADLTKPIVQIGNDSQIVYGFSIQGMGLIAQNAAGDNGPGCLYFAGGAHEADVLNCTFVGGADTLHFEAGASYPCSLIKLSHISAWDGTNTTVKVVYPQTGSFTTGIYFSNAYINGPNTTGYGIEINKGQALHLANTYVDLAPEHGVHALHGPRLRMSNTTLDNAAGAALIYVDWGATGEVNPDYDITRYIEGDGDMLGTVKWSSGAGPVTTNYTALSTNAFGSIAPPSDGVRWMMRNGLVRNPYLAGPIRMGTVFSPLSAQLSIESSADDASARLSIYHTALADQDSMRTEFIATNVFLVAKNPAGNAATLFHIDFDHAITNQPVEVRLFRDTGTSGTRLFHIFKGDGTGTLSAEVDASSGNIFTVGALTLGGNISVSSNSGRLIVGSGTDGTGIFDFDFSSIATHAGSFRFFRNTVTTSVPLIDVMKGDGSATVAVEINGRTGAINSIGQLSAGFVHPSNMTASTLAQTDGIGNLVSIANTGPGVLVGTGLGTFSYTTHPTFVQDGTTVTLAPGTSNNASLLTFVTVSGSSARGSVGFPVNGGSDLTLNANNGSVAISMPSTGKLFVNGALNVTNALPNTIALWDINTNLASGAAPYTVKVDSTDTASGYLGAKIVAGSNVTLTTNNVGGAETLTIASTAGGGGGGSTNYNFIDPIITSAATNVSIRANGIDNGLIRQSAGTSVIGRSANSGGNVADIPASADGQFLVRTASTLVFAALAVTNHSVVAGANITVTPGGSGTNKTWTIAATGTASVTADLAEFSADDGPYLVTSSSALVDFATTSGQPAQITLPGAGTYLVTATVGPVISEASGSGYTFEVKLWDGTNAADIPASSRRIGCGDTGVLASATKYFEPIVIRSKITVTGSTIIQIYAQLTSTGGSTIGSVVKDYTTLDYLKL